MVDRALADNTAKFIAECVSHCPKIRCVREQENSGIDCDYDKVVAHATGEIRASRYATLVELGASDRSGDVALFITGGSERSHRVSSINVDDNAIYKLKSRGLIYHPVQVVAKN